MAQRHHCSAGWKIGAHLPDDCAGAGTEGDSCTTALLAGREGCGYTMTALLAGTEGDSCTTALLAGREGCGYTMTALLAGTEKIAVRLRSLEG